MVSLADDANIATEVATSMLSNSKQGDLYRDLYYFNGMSAAKVSCLSFMTLRKSYHAITSGSFAAAGSIFGKLIGFSYFEDLIFIRVTFFCVMLICNACVWTFFVKALQNCKSSLSATLISTSTNYIITAAVGFLIFNEVTSILWWSGSSIVVLGLILIVRDQETIVSKSD